MDYAETDHTHRSYEIEDEVVIQRPGHAIALAPGKDRSTNVRAEKAAQ